MNGEIAENKMKIYSFHNKVLCQWHNIKNLQY